MADKFLIAENWSGGISESDKIGQANSFNFDQNINTYDEPTNLTLNPAAVKESGSVVTGLIKWIVSGQPYNTNLYAIDENGVFYQRTSAGVWSVLKTVTNCYGQGLEMFNNYVYYVQNTQVGRYGPLNGSPIFTDNWQTGLSDTSASKFAPIKNFVQGLAVGHANNIGWWDGATWNANTIVLLPGNNVRALEVIDEFLVAGTWTGSTVNDSEKGYLFFWDGTVSTSGGTTDYNFFVEMPEGGVNALLNSRNRLISLIGSSGYLYLGFAPFQKVHRIPNVFSSHYVETYPGAVTNWKGIFHFGTSANTDATAIVNGVYKYGSLSDHFAESLNFSYTLSTGSTGSSVKIGAVKGDGDQLFIAWKDGTNYGVDMVDKAATPYATGYLKTLQFDAGRPGQQKIAQTIKVTHKPLQAGESIQIGYSIDRGAFVLGDVNSTLDSTYTRLVLPPTDGRFYEIQTEILLAASATSPTVLSHTLLYDDNVEEEYF